MKSQPTSPTSPKMLDEVRQVMPLHHYSMHTERCYLDWIRRDVHFQRMLCRENWAGGEQKIATGALNQENNGSNAVSFAESVVGAAVRAAVKP